MAERRRRSGYDTNYSSVAVVQCKMRGLFVVVVLIATVVSQGTAQRFLFGADFAAIQYVTNETGQQAVHLTAPILASPIPDFTGTIEVDIIAEDLPADDPRQSAEFGTDYIVNTLNNSSRTFTVTFLPKQNKSNEHVIQIVDDNILENKEYFIIRIHAVRFIGGAATRFTISSEANRSFAVVVIQDDDIVRVNWTVSQPITIEEQGVTVELSGDAYGVYAYPISIGVVCGEAVATNVEAAVPDRDFITVGTRLNFTGVGEEKTHSSTNVLITIIDDDIAEPREIFICTLLGGSLDSVQSMEPNLVTIEICDNDELIVEWASYMYEFNESQLATLELVTSSKFEAARVNILGRPKQLLNGDPNWFASLTVPGPGFPATIQRAQFESIIFGNAQVIRSGRTDVERTSIDFLFTPSSNSSFASFTIVDDDVLEFDELFIAQFDFAPEILSSWNARKGVNSIAYIVIRDDDSVEVNFNEDSYTVAESDTAVSVSLRIDGRFFVPVWAIVIISDGTASDPEDYSSTVRYNVTFSQITFFDHLNPPRPFAVSCPIFIDIVNDNMFEGVEYFHASIVQTSEVSRVRIGPQNTVNVTITDLVTVTFSPQIYTVTESDPAPLMIILDKPAAKDITVTVTTMDITATDTDDYIGGSFDVSIPAGSVKVTLNVSTLQDSIVEPAEYFKATLSLPGAPEGCVVGTPDMSYIAIVDDSTLIPVQFNPANYSVKEGVNGSAVIFLEALDDHDFDFTVTVNSLDGTAIDGFNYTGGPFEVIFPAGVNVVSFNVPILDDAIAECTKLFNLDLDIPKGASGMGVIRGSPDTAIVHILDDDDLHFSIGNADYMVKENIGSFVATVVASGPADFEYAVTVETSDGTAVGDDDFVSQRYQLVFPAGQTRIKFTVVITDDNLIEAMETFQLLLSIPEDLISKGVQVGPNSGSTVTIMDNDDDMSNDALCPTDKDSVWGIQWLAIAAGSIQSARCPGEGSSSVDGLAYRRCMTGVPAEWGSVNASECESVAVRAVRKKTDAFISSLDKSNGTNRNLTEKERNMFQNISHDLSVVLDPSNERNRSILPQDLKTAVKFVDVVADLGENNGLFREESNETEETVADILSNVLDERNAPAFEATAQTDSTDPERGKAATPAVSILESTERVANVIATTLSKTKPSFTIARPNLAINGQRFSFNKLRTGIVFPGADIRDTLASFRNRDSLPQIHLPQSFLRAAKGIEASLEEDTVEVVHVVMNNMENYLPSDVIKQNEDVEEEAETFPASRVISSQILGYDGGEVDTKERVEVTFPVNVKSKGLPVPPGKVKQFRCAFFNFKAEEGNQTGGWSYRGVETDVVNTSHVRCIASHLTSFVVLVSIVPSAVEPPALDYITYIGCSISLLCLLASIIFYLTLRKELIQKLHNFVHLNLCIALSLGLLFFLTGIQTATANIYACKVMTALLHYFFLATFTWTLCEAVLIYILLVKVFGANERKWIYLYLALGWVLPIPVVVITGGARHDYYLIRASFDQSHPHYNSIKACWLPTENGVIFAFIGPMVAIILVNAVLLTISLVSLARSQCGRVSSRNDEKRQKYMEVGKQLLKATVILVPLLGFTWIIGLFAVGEEGKVFAYLFVLANVFQGLFIFVLHVLRHEKVYGKIKSKLPNISKLVTAYTGSARSSAKSTHASTSDTRKVSFALESEAIIESGVKKDEDAESIKDGRDQDIKLDVITESVPNEEGNECEEYHVVTTTALEMSAVTTGAFEETEEKAKGDSTEDHAGQNRVEFTSGEQSGNEAGGVMDSVC